MIFLFFLIGASIASFSQVLITDTHSGQFSLTRRSCCTSCGKILKSWHLFPVLSYLFLKGKCGFCQKKIPLTSFLFESIFGVTFALSYILQKPLIWFVWLTISLYLSLEDYYHQEIFFLSTIFMHLFLLLIAFLTKNSFYPLSFFYCFFLFLLLSFFLKGKMGGGDWLILLFWSPLLPFFNLLKLLMCASLCAIPFAIVQKEPLPFLPFLTLSLLFLEFF